MTDTKRLVAAIGLSIAVLFLWQFFISPPPASKDTEEKSSQEETSAEPGSEQGPADGNAATTDPAKAADGQPATAPEETIEPVVSVLETEHFKLGLTNIGGRALSYQLITPDRYQDRGDLLAPISALGEDGKISEKLPFGTELSGVGLGPNSPFEVREATAERVVYSWKNRDGTLEVIKTFTLGKSDYGVDVSLDIKNAGGAEMESTVAIDLFGVMSSDQEPGLFSLGRPVISSCAYDDDEVEHLEATDDPERFENKVKWIAVGEPYFVLVVAGEEDADACRIGSPREHQVLAQLENGFSLDPGASRTFLYHLYLGPKETDTLESFGHGIDRTIDYGWFEFLARPIRWVMLQLFHLVGNWGFAIILLTFLIRGGMWPITQKSQDSMMRMREISPQLKELQEKYKNDPMVMQQKQMELFRKHNVSPFGCLPLFLQIPIWFALYRTIYVTAELYNAPFISWITDLSSPDPYYILPIAAGALFIIQQQLMPSASADIRQKILMKILPMIFVVVMLFLPSGLNLYMLVSSFVGMGQTLYSRRKQDRAKAEGEFDDTPDVEVSDTGKAGRAARRQRQRQRQKSSS